ncbi:MULTISPECIES: peptidoglycan glycosyltransferase PbpC [Proteus]|uniref:peptidoglycan glycosyltransferase PbpC n=1 Tax=Proteus TaxID=583 RepID=UPI001330359B|nr:MULTISPECIES: peptidoglycan glycosyltransferase PbpC [Proteus]MCM2366929.1 peptidoglycan glycosyltransferase PbpC [Proteus sp. FZP2095]MCO4180503.1 peptidoglycan glycosyltransferase PbpC [Proteus terrae]MCO4189509.1 peptidoglycan glycosyltransferase PbpC [Proteus terrae]QKD68851.1 peptidoglycan glycosyltransferase PbpC [Proteus terrae subsp. cibarius]QKD74025.1 peptidoglycan glycosyltransferase PbpC [Proteus terrae subsp. cibarius]
MKLGYKQFIAVIIIFLLAMPILVWIADKIWPLPDPEPQIATIVTAQDGTPLWRFADKEGVWRYHVKLTDVSPEYLEALITYEDRWFYQHPGVNPMSILRAAWQDLSSGRIVSGGSTLSMQVARLIDPHSRTLGGKIKQLWRTLQLEWYYSKDEILEIYLNRAPFGGTLEGIGAASWAYLGKSPADLSAGEATLMAVLPQAPSRLRPDRYPERAQAARDKVLDRLAEYQIWPQEKVDEIKEEQVLLAPRQTPQLAPLLARRMYNEKREPVITTTIDINIQRQLEDIANQWKYQLADKTSLAILVVDHTDMSVKGYVGSADFNDNSRFGHVDMISAWRSPGSTLKPFIYALALDEGLIHAESLLQDVPRRFDNYRPGNFDSDFNGAVSASEALSRSLNLPAVQLIEVYGAKKFAAKLRHNHLEMRFPYGSEPNLALILGGTATRMDELVSAFSALARQGKTAPLRFKPEQIIEDRVLMSPGSAWIIRRILAGEARPRPDSAISPVVPLAWKTGTSYGYRDAWSIGVNARYTIGVWVGRPDGTPVAGQFGFATAVPIMNQVNNLLTGYFYQNKQRPPTDLRPNSVTAATICWPTGKALPKEDSNCRVSRRSWILDNTIPPTLLNDSQEGILGINEKIWLDNEGKRTGPNCPNAELKDIALWPIALEAWLPEKERRAKRLPPISETCPPIKEDIIPLFISGIRAGDLLRPLPGETNLEITVSTQGGSGMQWWFLNGEQIGKTGNGETFSYLLEKRGKYQLSVLDLSGQTDMVNFIFR